MLEHAGTRLVAALRRIPPPARRTCHPLADSLPSIPPLRAKAPFVEIAALLAADESRPELATQLLGAADRLREITGAPQLRPWHAPHARVLASARA